MSDLPVQCDTCLGPDQPERLHSFAQVVEICDCDLRRPRPPVPTSDRNEEPVSHDGRGMMARAPCTSCCVGRFDGGKAVACGCKGEDAGPRSTGGVLPPVNEKNAVTGTVAEVGTRHLHFATLLQLRNFARVAFD